MLKRNMPKILLISPKQEAEFTCLSEGVTFYEKSLITITILDRKHYIDSYHIYNISITKTLTTYGLAINEGQPHTGPYFSKEGPLTFMY